MTEEQWNTLLAVIDGRPLDPTPVGFIIDSPWLPGWAGISTLDYYASEEKWFQANIKAIRQFPEAIFLPGFWSEFGMCTEPSAFGTQCLWHEHELPFAERIITDPAQIHDLEKPDPRTAGFAPFMLHRLKSCEPRIQAEGHQIRFAVARGPLNLASFLMGNTEFLMGIHMNPDEIHRLLDIITEFLVDWVQLQAKTFPSIDGVLILDDIVGFIGDNDFRAVALPYLKRIYDALDVRVKFFHNDAPGLICAPYLPEIGINLFNFGFEHSLAEMRELTQGKVALLGNIPPRDVLAAGTPEEVQAGVRAAIASVPDTRGILLSCGGGMPSDVPTANIEAFLQAAGHG